LIFCPRICGQSFSHSLPGFLPFFFSVSFPSVVLPAVASSGFKPNPSPYSHSSSSLFLSPHFSSCLRSLHLGRLLLFPPPFLNLFFPLSSFLCSSGDILLLFAPGSYFFPWFSSASSPLANSRTPECSLVPLPAL